MKKYQAGGRTRGVPSYEEDMTPPPGMRNFRSQGRRTNEPPVPSYEEDITPPRGMMRPRDEEPMPIPPKPPANPPRRMKAGGGAVKPHYGSTEDIVGHGKTQASAKADYARKMKAAGLKPRGMASGGAVASKRADGCAMRGKTKGRMI